MEAINSYKNRSIKYAEFVLRLAASINTYDHAVAIAVNLKDGKLISSIYKNKASAQLNMLKHFKEAQDGHPSERDLLLMKGLLINLVESLDQAVFHGQSSQA